MWWVGVSGRGGDAWESPIRERARATAREAVAFTSPDIELVLVCELHLDAPGGGVAFHHLEQVALQKWQGRRRAGEEGRGGGEDGR